jgi:hypothetical protein
VKRLQDVENVIKIEPKDNGPLFCEIHFYLNCAKEDNSKKQLNKYSLLFKTKFQFILS